MTVTVNGVPLNGFNHVSGVTYHREEGDFFTELVLPNGELIHLIIWEDGLLGETVSSCHHRSLVMMGSEGNYKLCCTKCFEPESAALKQSTNLRNRLLWKLDEIHYANPSGVHPEFLEEIVRKFLEEQEDLFNATLDAAAMVSRARYSSAQRRNND